MLIRRLVPADAAAYRALMLVAYERHPDAFTSTVEERAGLPLAWWENRIADGDGADELVFGAFDGERLIGAAGLSFAKRPKERHKAKLFGMYVDPAARQGGAGRRLVEAVLAAARMRAGVKLVQLTVTDGNTAAQKLYERCGFVPFGIEPQAVAVGDRLVAKLHMWRELCRKPHGDAPPMRKTP
ncbi:MAG TPA: GNAT family N-acetyltransferase [Paucimonas sp.]|nr:GNAT family N-acetyltransferase [Paucimonas sp.]